MTVPLTLELEWGSTDVELDVGFYPTGNIAIFAIDGETGEMFSKLTVNLPDEPNSEPLAVWVKDWSENYGTLLSLVKAGYVEPTGRYASSGFLQQIPEHKLIGALGEYVAATIASGTDLS